jgi:pimeloyl-ACP methyl ester carboxylesterase
MQHLQDVAEISVVDLSACQSRAEMADAVLKTAPDRFALAGMSMGGWVGQVVASQAPERVTKLALIGTWARPDAEFNKVQRETINEIRTGQFEKVIGEHVLRIVHPDLRNDATLIKTLKDMIVRAGPEVVLRHIQAMLNDYDSRACLPKIAAPTLVIAGRQDPLFSMEEHQFIAAQIRGARVAVIEDCGHAIQLERPHAATALLRYWLTYF